MCERLVGSIDGDVLGLGVAAPVESGEDPVAGGVGGDLEELVEPVTLLTRDGVVVADAVAVFDERHERVLGGGVDGVAAAEPDRPETGLGADRDEPDRP